MPQEVVLTTSSSGDSSILLHDLHNSSHVQTFRQCATTKGGVALTNSKSQFLAAQLDKGVVHVYSWGKDSVGTKMILPEKIRCLQMSPSTTWCVGGSDSGKLFLWEVASGNLLFAREAHYQPLTHPCFSSDEAFLFTGGDDAVVHMWRVLDLVDLNMRSEEIVPIQSWNEHTLAITGIVCGSGTTMTARLYTSSLDKTVKIWDISTLSLMTTILFPSGVTALVIDPAERAIFVGTSSSIIHQFNLVHSIGGKYESLGGDPSHPLQAGDARQFDFHGHATDITTIALSFDGTLLVSADKSGEIFVWDVGSRQVLRKIKGQTAPVTNVIIFLKPDSPSALTEIQQFKRLQNERGRTDHDIWQTISDQQVSSYINDADIAENGIQQLTTEGSESKLKSRLLESEDESQRLKVAYGELKSLHEKLWKRYVDEKKQQE